MGFVVSNELSVFSIVSTVGGRQEVILKCRQENK